MMSRVSTKGVRELAKKRGVENVPDLVRLIQDGNGTTSANAIKRYWYDDPSLTMYHRDVIMALCRALDCKVGDLLSVQSARGHENTIA